MHEEESVEKSEGSLITAAESTDVPFIYLFIIIFYSGFVKIHIGVGNNAYMMI